MYPARRVVPVETKQGMHCSAGPDACTQPMLEVGGTLRVGPAQAPRTKISNSPSSLERFMTFAVTLSTLSETAHPQGAALAQG